MNLIENIKERVNYGKPCMEKLSELPIKEIISILERIWENHSSEFYTKIPNLKCLEKEYNNKVIQITYHSDLEIHKIKICWSYDDSLTIELSSLGLLIEYCPEEGLCTTLLDLTWVLVEPFFFK